MLKSAATGAPVAPGALPGHGVLSRWRRLERFPFGRWLFSRMLAWLVPYTGSISPLVEELRPGFARVSLRDRRGLRNHLRSIHAIALVNLGEVTSGLAMIASLPPGVRSIVIGLEADFLRKARGRLVAECACQVPPTLLEPMDQVVSADVRDESGETVARIRVTWRLAPA